MDPDDVPGRLLPSAFYGKQAAISNGTVALTEAHECIQQTQGQSPLLCGPQQVIAPVGLSFPCSESQNYEDQNLMDTLCVENSTILGDFLFQSMSWQLWSMGQIQLAACFLMTCELRMGFTFSNGRKKSTEE